MKTSVLICVAIFTSTAATFAVDPPPDGGYPNNNTAEGQNALFDLTDGTDNTDIGFNALYNNIGDTSQNIYYGSANSAVGSQSLFANTNGYWNTAIGSQALLNNTTGAGNTAIGKDALSANTTANNNTATGAQALMSNTGFVNTADGAFALMYNTTGEGNTAVGDDALQLNTIGGANTGIGTGALGENTEGLYNVAAGNDALFFNTTGLGNTGIGTNALGDSSTGSNNAALGYNALEDLRQGSDNIAVGMNAGLKLKSGDWNIYIGNNAAAGESGTIRVGDRKHHTNTYIAGINGVTIAGGVGVVVDSSGHLGTVTSSARFKDNIQPMAKSSEAVLSLEPVTFRYKKDLDPKAIPQFGLVAEEVAKVDPDLVVKGDDGKPLTVRYEAVNAMLLNEFLKEHRKVESLQATVTRQQDQIDKLTAAMEKVAADVQAAHDGSSLVVAETAVDQP